MIRACTGFDRDLEDGEAIRRQMRQIANLKLNANDNFELAAAQMLHVSPEALTLQESGTDPVRNDGGKALNRQAYHEATDPVRMLVFVRQREC